MIRPAPSHIRAVTRSCLRPTSSGASSITNGTFIRPKASTTATGAISNAVHRAQVDKPINTAAASWKNIASRETGPRRVRPRCKKSTIPYAPAVTTIPIVTPSKGDGRSSSPPRMKMALRAKHKAVPRPNSDRRQVIVIGGSSRTNLVVSVFSAIGHQIYAADYQDDTQNNR